HRHLVDHLAHHSDRWGWAFWKTEAELKEVPGAGPTIAGHPQPVRAQLYALGSLHRQALEGLATEPFVGQEPDQGIHLLVEGEEQLDRGLVGRGGGQLSRLRESGRGGRFTQPGRHGEIEGTEHVVLALGQDAVIYGKLACHPRTGPAFRLWRGLIDVHRNSRGSVIVPVTADAATV